jgi:hypothetical protein
MGAYTCCKILGSVFCKEREVAGFPGTPLFCIRNGRKDSGDEGRNTGWDSCGASGTQIQYAIIVVIGRYSGWTAKHPGICVYHPITNLLISRLDTLLKDLMISPR